MLRRKIRRWHRWLTRQLAGPIDWGDLRRLTPIDSRFGARRGQPVDRYYIDRFLEQHRADIHGVVLETGHNEYSRTFGHDVSRSEVLHAVEGNPAATIVGDLASGPVLPSETFDCILLTQTLQYVFASEVAIRACHTALKPGGVLLLSVPGISQGSRGDREATGEYWRFTTTSVRRLLVEAFGALNVLVEAHGNLLTSVAFLYGLAAEELTRSELEHYDQEYEMTVVARAVKEQPPKASS